MFPLKRKDERLDRPKQTENDPEAYRCPQEEMNPDRELEKRVGQQSQRHDQEPENENQEDGGTIRAVVFCQIELAA